MNYGSGLVGTMGGPGEPMPIDRRRLKQLRRRGLSRPMGMRMSEPMIPEPSLNPMEPNASMGTRDGFANDFMSQMRRQGSGGGSRQSATMAPPLTMPEGGNDLRNPEVFNDGDSYDAPMQQGSMSLPGSQPMGGMGRMDQNQNNSFMNSYGPQEPAMNDQEFNPPYKDQMNSLQNRLSKIMRLNQLRGNQRQSGYGNMSKILGG